MLVCKLVVRDSPPPILRAQVYRGRRKHTGQTVAIKTISKHGKSQKDQITLRKEINILSDLQHENIIRWMDAIETADNFIVITEFAQGMHRRQCSHRRVAAAAATAVPAVQGFSEWAGRHS